MLGLQPFGQRLQLGKASPSPILDLPIPILFSLWAETPRLEKSPEKNKNDRQTENVANT
jgi:hypothetical protein